KVADPGGTFDLSAANNKLTVTVHGDALPDIDLTGTATDPIDGVVAKIDAAFRAPAVNGLAAVRRLGNRILISTANLGSADNALDVTGVAAGSLGFVRLDGAAIGGGVDGLGRSEPAFIQSDDGPFTIEENANFSLGVNNGVLGAGSPAITVNF